MPDSREAVRFDDRVAIVTGAGGGLGRSHALGLAARGARVVVNDLGSSLDGTGSDGEHARAVVARIEQAGGRAVVDESDVGDPAGAATLIDRALNAFGQIDILVHNAGILRDKTLAKMTTNDFEVVVRVHLLGAAYVTNAAFPHMQQRGYGRVVVTTSSVGLFGNFGQSNYGAAKLALVGFMHSLKLEGAKHDILVNAVAPLAHTRMSDGIFPADLASRLDPALVTPAVLFLCSEACRRSGDIIAAGGGWYGRAAMLEGAGLVLDDPTPEAFAEQYERLRSLDSAREFERATDEFAAVFALLTRDASDDGDRKP